MMDNGGLKGKVLNAEEIPYVTADEAYLLMHTELERLLVVLDTLSAEDWGRATACTAWSVRDILAHQAGGYASGTGYVELIHQALARPKPGELLEDAINARQLAERVGHSPAKLLAELRQVGPVAAKKWAYQFHLAKLLTIPHPVSGGLAVRHLMWVIHSRDTWMHRLDICRAANLPFEQTAEHDGRIAALVMLDVAKWLAPRLDGKAIQFDLEGSAGAAWKVGRGEPVSRLCMDVLDFNVFVSGRLSFAEALSRAEVSGDRQLVESVLQNILILF